ncbi:hypothetical protein JVU11DRAFT_3139 [Chiua virens]|nr:hypothetical protein JVU11DRAFT_3139 [Chiua virens]
MTSIAFSPGPTWTVLHPAPSSSPSTRTSTWSDFQEEELDMGDDEDDDTHRIHKPPISKRKAPAESPGEKGARKPSKLSRVDLEGHGRASGRRSLSWSPPRSHGPRHASHAVPARTQPVPSSSGVARKKTVVGNGMPQTQPGGTGMRVASTSSAVSSSTDFQESVSQRVQKLNAMDNERAREQNGGRRDATARKQTVQPKNMRKVTTNNLLVNAQTSNVEDTMVAWTRVRPKGKTKRTNLNKEMRPLNLAKDRGGDQIELTDSSDSTRRPRPLRNGAGSRPNARASASKDDPIVIPSGSEGEPPVSVTQRRKAPPANAEVITIMDSEEEAAQAAPFQRAPTSQVAPSSSQRMPVGPSSASAPALSSLAASSPQRAAAAPSSPPVPAIAPSPSTSRVTSQQVSSQGPSTAPHPPVVPASPSPPPEVPDSAGDSSPSPDYTFGTFNDAFFDTAGDDTNDTWDGIGPSLDLLPEMASSEPSVDAADTTTNASVAEGSEDTFFDSYLNLDRLGDERTDGDAMHGRDEVEARTGMDGVVDGPTTSTGQGGEEDGSSMSADMDPTHVEGGNAQLQNVEENPISVDKAEEDDDTRMQSPEDSDVGLNDRPPAQKARSPDTPESGEIFSQQLVRGPGEVAPPARKARSPNTPESGEIFSQDVRGGARENCSPSVEAQSPVAPVPVTALVSTSIPVDRPSSATGSEKVSSASGSPRSSASVPNASQPRVRMGALVMPDISLYKGIRFKRPEARDNSFFSRALGGGTRVTAKAPVTLAESRQETEAESGVSPSVEAPPSVAVGEVHNQTGNADMQEKDAASGSVSMPEEPVSMSTQQAVDVPIVTGQQSPSTSAVANVGLPPPTQSASPSIPETPIRPPEAPQPFVRSSSRPFIAPPRQPRPGTPMSLAELINDLRRDQLQQNASRSTAVSSRETSQGSGEVLMPPRSSSQSRSCSPFRSSRPSTRPFGRTPSLDGLRSLLAKRSASKDGREAPAESVAVPTPSKVGTSADTTGLASKVAYTTYTPTVCRSPPVLVPMSAPGPLRHKDKAHGLPFEAFISPVQVRGRDRCGDASRSPTVSLSRMNVGGNVSQRSRHARRASASAVFELPRPPRQPRFSEGGSTGTGTGTDVFAVSDGGSAGDVNEVNDAVEHAMDVDENGIASTGVEGGEEKEVAASEDEVDAADALQELASVHLSQESAEAAETRMAVPPPIMDSVDREVVEMDMSDKSTGGAAVEENDPQEIEPAPVESCSHETTPDLVLPEDDATEFPMDAEPHSGYNHLHERHYSGGNSSIDECDALLSTYNRDGCESGSEEVPSGPSSKTVSSTSLAVPPAHSRSPSRATTSSADPLDLVSRPATVPQPSTDDDAARQQPILTWESHVAAQRQRAPVYKLAKNLPHSLQDHLKVLPEWFRNSEQGRKVFEAHIREAIAGQPDTPPIEIYDNNIGEEVTPAWEFYYTDEMWFAEGVSPPDVKGLESCDCVGRCDPKGNCACARRQFKWVKRYVDEQLIPPTWPGSPFVYDHKGALQRLECPIFECNRFCRCDDDCPNRVVQNGRKWPVHIARTQNKGWGVSAGNKKIPKGTYLGIYAGELLTEQEGDERGRYYDLYGRTYLFSIDFHHLKFDEENGDDWENLYVVDAYHAGNFTRFLNHSCDPNCKIFACYIDDADVDKPLLAVFTIRDVEPWEELCFSYYGDIDEKREEIEQATQAGMDMVRERAVYAQCRYGRLIDNNVMAFRLLLLLSLLRGALALWPIPTGLTTGTTPLLINPGFYFDVAIEGAPGDLYQAVEQAEYYLQNDKLGRLVVGRGANDSALLTHAATLTTLQLTLTKGATVNSISTESVKPLGNRSEEYVLTIPGDGSPATLTANSTLGLYRGLTTFGQLWYYYNGKTYTLEAPYAITDAPAYVRRVLLFHVCPTFPVPDLIRTLDAMSWVKINTFHWHITDSQSFPLIVAQYPELATNGAYSAENTYSPEDVQYIVQYAAQEIDTPGHTAIIGETYPDYVACFHETPWSTYANEPPAGQLRFALPEVVNFTTNLLTDVAATLPSSYFSTGGDELNTNCYVNDTLTQQQLNSTNTTLIQALQSFTNTTHSALIAQGKTPVVWEEMVLQFNLTLSPETIIMVWISSEDAAAVAELGYRFVQAPSNYFYLDCGAGGWLGDYPAGNSWCDPFKTWSWAYTYDPLANLTESQYHLVLGGEQLLWTEQSGAQNLDPIVWPRAASSAEIFWSAKQPSGAPFNVTEALPRLQDMRYRMVQRGVNAIPLQPEWCALRPYACDLYA